MGDFLKESSNWLIGLKPVLELLQQSPDRIDQVLLVKGRNGGEPHKIGGLCKAAGIFFKLVPEEALSRMTGSFRHQGVAARLRQSVETDYAGLLESAKSAPLPLLIALDQVQDVGNAGTLARTVFALGAAGLVMPKHNSVHLGAGASRASAGALVNLPVARVVNLGRAVEQANEAGFVTYAAQRGDGSLNALGCALGFPALLVLGNEEKGIRPGVARKCAFTLTIPFLRPFDSLNVAQAGAILVSCFLRARHDT